MSLDQIDYEKTGPMTVQLAGSEVVLPAASEFPWRLVVAAAEDLRFFGSIVWPTNVRVSLTQLRKVQHAWLSHNGLPEVAQMRRLIYMMERYSKGIEFDLRAHLQLSLGELWRGRRWRELLNYIDQLPSNTQMNRLMSQDEEHMTAIMRSQKGEQSSAPSMADWSLLNSQIATLIDAVNRGTAVQQAIANPKGAKPKIVPMPRPATAAEKVEKRLTKERHEEMVSLLLPGRRRDEVS